MTGFIIDVGDDPHHYAAAWGRVGRCDIILMGAMDGLPENAPQSALDAALVAAILGELHKPKMLETVRERLLSMWSLIAPLAVTDPDGFDEILLAYSELTTVLPTDRSEAISRRKASAQQR